MRADVIKGVLKVQKGYPFPKCFIVSVAVILCFVGLAKVWSSFGTTKMLSVPDPITGVQLRHLMLVVGVLELIVAGFCILSKSQKLSLSLLAWFATHFVGYRVGLWWIGWHLPCNCLGNLTDALHLSPQLADNVMKAILTYLLAGSYGLLFWQWRQSRAVSVHSPDSMTEV